VPFSKKVVDYVNNSGVTPLKHQYINKKKEPQEVKVLDQTRKSSSPRKSPRKHASVNARVHRLGKK
jgi:hypothetical protein